MVHGIDFLGRRPVINPQTTNININYGGGYGGYGSYGIFSGRVPYGAQYQFMNNPYGYIPEQSGSGFLGKLLFGVGLGVLISKISGSGSSKSQNAQNSGDGVGFFQRIGNWFKGLGSKKEIPSTPKGEQVSNGVPTQTRQQGGVTQSQLEQSGGKQGKVNANANTELTLVNNGNLTGGAANTTKANTPVQNAVGNMKSAKTSEALLRAINDANIALADVNTDYDESISNYNSKYADANLSDESVEQEIKSQEKIVSDAKANVKTASKALQTSETLLKKAERDYAQALAKRDNISATISDYKTKSVAGNITAETRKIYEDNIAKLEAGLVAAETELNNSITAKQEAKNAKNKANTDLQTVNNILSDAQTKLNDLKAVQSAKKERDDFKEKIDNANEHLEKLSKQENKKIGRYADRAGRREQRSTKYANRDWPKLSQAAEKSQDRALNKMEKIIAGHVDVTSADTTVIQSDTLPAERKQQQTDAVNEYLAKDTIYQKYKNFLDNTDKQLNEFETKYNIERTNTLPTTADLDDKENYTKLFKKYEKITKDLSTYRNEMANWQDGPLPANSFRRIGTTEYTNIERITLKNGQRAWKADQGVFYPLLDGGIGGPEVPKELYEE